MNNEDSRVAKAYAYNLVGKPHSYNSLGQQELLSARHINGKIKAELNNRACSKSWNC